MKPLVRSEIKPSNNPFIEKYKKENPTEEMWINDLYLVNVIRDIPCEWIRDDDGKPTLMTHLSIKNKDRSAKVDWRNFQYIKNQLVGEENEGCELFPAESRLVDGANQYHIFCFQNPEMRFPFGFNDGRIVSEKRFLEETQRPFAYNRKPKDLKESEERIQQMINNGLNKNTNE
jgi:hypothetical protein